jgi:choline-sulfatase
MQIDYDESVMHFAVQEIYARRRSADARPFFMTVSLTHPHDPYVTTQKYWDLYRPEEIDDPRVGFIPVERRDPHSQSLYYHFGQDKLAIDAAATRRARHGYYGMISYVDDLFGRLESALQETGYSENTVIVFVSDHGDMMGERGMWFKKTLFEPAIRVPLMIARPNGKPGRIAAPVTLMDVFPTLAGFASGGNPVLQTDLDGRDLGPALDGAPLGGPIFVEHLDGGTKAPRVMVRLENHKLVLSRAYPDQLYDLAADPLELCDVSANPAYAKIKADLTSLATNCWDLEALADQVARGQTARKLIDSALAKGRREVWDFLPRHSSEQNMFVRRGAVFPDIERSGYLPYGKN